MAEMGRITAGLPGLAPQIRQGQHVQETTAAFQEAAIREQLLRDEATFERDGDSDVSSLVRQMGRPLSAAGFISKLKRLNPNLIFEPSIQYPELTGIYVEVSRRNLTFGWDTEKKHVCGMPSPPAILPEFSVRHYKWKEMPAATDKYELKLTREFVDETRGWRTVLLRLIKERLVSMSHAEQLFDIAGGRSSRYWQMLTT